MSLPAPAYEGLVVLGPPRSGTTLVRRLLDAHPNISCPPETNVFSGIGRLLQEDPIGEGVRLGVVSGLAYAGIAPEETLRRLRELAFGLHRDIAAKQGKPQWASKTAYDAFYVDAIEQLCGKETRFLCIARHALDTACSIQELCAKNESYLPEIHAYIQRHAFPLEAFAHLWRDLTERIAKFAADHPANAMSIRYEDLVANPVDVMGKVFAFLGEASDPKIVEGALARRESVGLGDFKAYTKTRVETASVGRWKELSPHTRSRLGSIVNSTLVARGYEPIPVVEERTDEDARRRYEMGLLVQSMKRPE